MGFSPGVTQGLARGVKPGLIRPGGAASATPLLLDTYPGAAAAYSLRKLRTAYSGSAIRVRRSSDNAEADIGFSGNALDTSALLAHVGAGDGFVATWYDQVGSNDVTASIATRQRQVVDAGSVVTSGGKPCARRTGDNYGGLLSGETGITLAQPIQVFAVFKTEATLPVEKIFGRTGFFAGRFSAGNFQIYGGSYVTAFAYPDAEGKYIWNFMFDGPSSYIRGNSVEVASGDAGSNGMTGQFSVWSDGALYGSGARGDAFELIIFGESKTATEAAIEADLNDHYAVY